MYKEKCRARETITTSALTAWVVIDTAEHESINGPRGVVLKRSQQHFSGSSINTQEDAHAGLVQLSRCSHNQFDIFSNGIADPCYLWTRTPQGPALWPISIQFRFNFDSISIQVRFNLDSIWVLVQFDSIRFGLVGFGLVRIGSVRFGSNRTG